MALILVAHGTRRPGGVAMIEGLAAQVSTLVGGRVEVAFVDVVGPTPSEVLAAARAAGRRWCWWWRRRRREPPAQSEC